MTDIKETDLYELLEIGTGMPDNEKKLISVGIDGRFFSELEYIEVRHCRDLDQPVLLAIEHQSQQRRLYLHIFPLEKIQFYSLNFHQSVYNSDKIKELVESVCYQDEKKGNE